MNDRPPRLSLFSGFAAALLSKAIGFGTTLYLAARLGSVGLGEYGAVLGTLGLFGIAAQASLGAAASNLLARDRAKPAEFRRTATTIFAMVLCLSAVGATVLAVLSPIIATTIFRSSEMGPLLLLAAATLVILALQSVVDGALAGTHRFAQRNVLPLVQAAAMLGLSVVLGGAGAVGAVLAYTISSAAVLLIGAFALRHDIPISSLSPALVAKQSIDRVLRFCSPLIFNNVLVLGGSFAITSAIAWSAGGLAELGHYTFAMQMRVLVLVAPFLIHATFAPIVSAAHAERNSPTLSAQGQEALNLTLWSAWGAGACVALLAPLLVRYVGHDFNDAGILIGLNAALAVVMAVSNCAGIVLIGTERENKTIAPNAMLFGLVLALGVPSAIWGGALTATGALIGAQLCQLAMLTFAWERRLLSRPLVLGLIATASTGAITVASASGEWIVAIVLFVGSACLAYWCLGVPAMVSEQFSHLGRRLGARGGSN